MAATVIKFLWSRQENLTIENSNRAGMNSIKGGHFVSIFGVYKQHLAPRLETKFQTGAPSRPAFAAKLLQNYDVTHIVSHCVIIGDIHVGSSL